MRSVVRRQLRRIGMRLYRKMENISEVASSGVWGCASTKINLYWGNRGLTGVRCQSEQLSNPGILGSWYSLSV
jgi:hypothetical protein